MSTILLILLYLYIIIAFIGLISALIFFIKDDQKYYYNGIYKAKRKKIYSKQGYFMRNKYSLISRISTYITVGPLWLLGLIIIIFY